MKTSLVAVDMCIQSIYLFHRTNRPHTEKQISDSSHIDRNLTSREAAPSGCKPFIYLIHNQKENCGYGQIPLNPR